MRGRGQLGGAVNEGRCLHLCRLVMGVGLLMLGLVEEERFQVLLTTARHR